MTRPKKIILTVLASLAGLIVVLFIAAVIVLQSSWFSNFVRGKIISTLEDSTGAVVQIGSFQVDLLHLTIRIRDFVVHGTEAAGSLPLARIPLLEVRLHLFSGYMGLIDLNYIGIQRPEVNVMVFPDGKTNIPTPKTQQSSSGNTSSLKTVVDLKINRFELQNGLLQFAEQKTAFSAKGENLHALLNYVAKNPHYQGDLSIDPLILASGNRPPLDVHVNLPVVIETDGVSLNNARITTNQSRIVASASVENMNAPRISTHLAADVSLPELQRSMGLPIDTTAEGAPRTLTAELALQMNEQAHTVHVQTAVLALGRTTLQASGSLDPKTNSTVQFGGTLALQQLATLLNMSSAKPRGEVVIAGNARLDANDNYSVNGELNSRNLSVQSGTAELTNVTVHAPFHADPYLISVDGLTVSALGGTLDAKLFVEKMQQLSIEGTLRNFSLPVLAATFTGKHLGYSGSIDGFLKAAGDLKQSGAKGISAQARLRIVPGAGGVPIRGQLSADYAGATGAVNLGRSYVALPNSRLDLSGSLDRRIDLSLVSHSFQDFLPALNLTSTKPESSLPITLNNGVARVQAQVTGNLSAPHVTGHVDLNRFAVERRTFDHLGLDLAASPSAVAIQNGVLTRKTLLTNFDASIGLHRWSPVPRSPVTANLTIRNGQLADLMGMAGSSSMPATGAVSADVHVKGTYGNPLGDATLQVLNGSVDQQPFTRIYGHVNLADQLVTISPVEIDSAGGQISLTGTFRHPQDSFATGHVQLHIGTSGVQLAEVKPLQERSPGAAGVIQLAVDASADLKEVNKQSSVTVSYVVADFSARDLKVQNQDAGNITAAMRTVNGALNYTVNSDFAGSTVNVSGHTGLTKGYPTTADASIRNLSIAKVLSITGQTTIPATGDLSAQAHVSGTLQAPNADLSFDLAKANVYQETINRLQGSLRYSNTLVQIPSIELAIPAGTVTLTGSFAHPANDFNAGNLKLNLSSSDIHLARIEHVRAMQEGIGGTLHLAANLAASVRERGGARQVAISTLDANFSADALRMNHRDLGNAHFVAQTTGSTVNFHLNSDIADSQIQGSGQAQLTGEYPVRANLSFANIRYSKIAPFLSSTPNTAPAFEALVDGQASVQGPILNTDALNARLQLSRLALETNPAGSPTGAPPARAVALRNQGPIVVALDHDVLRVEHLDIEGDGTTLTASGGMNLKNPNSPLALKIAGNTNLSILQDADRDFYSSGTVDLDATVRGDLAKPLVNGRIELKNANINYTGAPNGLSNGNGVILLSGTSATIQSLTGESGGGKISATGFVGFGGPVMNYNLRASATKVRVRYSGISVVSNASIALFGNTNRSLLRGDVSIQRISYAASSDAGSLLSSFASTPPSSPTAPSKLLENMHLDIHVITAPDMRVVTTYAEGLSILANLTVRGTAANPGVLGQVTVTQGQLVFFGNKYTVTMGTVNFFNPTQIQPVINVSLQTVAQGVNVTLGVSGPMNDLKLTYRSDPPLTFEQIVELLATNTTPPNPQIAANQPTAPQQSFTQMGESAILGQAVANPLASRLQRVFGLTQFKIDPTIAGPNGQPGARVTLQEKIASNIIFTYITDVTQSNDEIIRVEWDLTDRFSAVGLRDYNGNVSLEFFYKFKVR